VLSHTRSSLLYYDRIVHPGLELARLALPHPIARFFGLARPPNPHPMARRAAVVSAIFPSSVPINVLVTLSL
jgi:hypothetical protein